MKPVQIRQRIVILSLLFVATVFVIMTSQQRSYARPSKQISPTSLPDYINPIDDSYTSPSSPNSNFGAATLLKVVWDYYYPGREVYLKFDLGNVVPTGAKIAYGALKMCVYNKMSYTASVDLYSVADTAWEEETITYNTRPSMGTKLSTSLMQVTTNSQIIWLNDIAAHLQQQHAQGKRYVSLGLRVQKPADLAMAEFLSKETTSPCFNDRGLTDPDRPELVFAWQ
jgi:hypothetical protein